MPLHVMHIAGATNGAAWMHQMLCGLRDKGYRATAVIGGDEGTLGARLRADRIPYEVADVDIFSSSSRAAAARKFARLVALLRRKRPDIVHFHLYPTIFIGRLAAWVADVPARFSMIPGPYYLEAPVLSQLDVSTAPFDSKVIASCEFTRSLYARAGVPRDHVELIYYGQDATLFDPAQADGARVRRQLGIAAGRPVVGDVAYFYPPPKPGPFSPPHLVNRGLKGHEVLLRAIPEVLRRVPDALFMLIGDGWGPEGAAYMEEMRKLASDLGVGRSVLFAGARSDIPDTLMAFDVSVQCSLNENLGGSIESLLMGRPLVASDVGGLPDAVKHERTGLLVPPGDHAALAAAIARLLEDRALADRLGREGQAFAREYLTLDRAVDDLDHLYRSELARVSGQGAAARRGHRLSRLLARAAFIGPWTQRHLLRPVTQAVRAQPANRVVHMAACTENAEWLAQITGRLRAHGREVTAVIDAPERSLAERLRAEGVPYAATPLSFAVGSAFRLPIYLLRVPLTVLRLARQFRKLRVAAVHTHVFASIVIGRIAAWLARVPCRVSMVTGPLHLEAPFTRTIDRLTGWMDHRIVAGSRATYDRYRDMGFAPPRLVSIPYGVDPTRFDPTATDGSMVRRELGIAASAPVIGVVAYFYPPRSDWQTPPAIRGRGLKGHEDFLAAARLVREQYPDARFLIVGKGLGDAGERYRLSLIESADARALGDAVVFTGHRGDVPALLAAMDVAVQCSLSENYGGTIESLLMRRPTVATRVGGMPETVRHEQTGLLVPPSDPVALAAAICRMLSQPEEARQMGAAGRTLMLEQFQIERTVAAIDALYDELLAPRKLGAAAVPQRRGAA